MSDLISVIVPIYKVEDYLPRCVDSLINQSYRNLEIILVDDGSPDKCPTICDDYASKDSRIKVIHKENGGLSDARNAGMAVINGRYVSFIDSDDYISLNFFEILYNTIKSEKSDIVECGVVKCYEDNHIDEYKDDLEIVSYETQSALSELIAEDIFKQHVWNKLYKTDLVLDIPYVVGKLNEDEFWTYQVFGKAKKVTKINITMYFYFQRESSIMGNKYSLRRLDALEGKINRQEYIEKNYPELSTQARINLFGSCIFAYQSALKFMDRKDRKEAKRVIYRYKNRCRLSRSEIAMVNSSSRKYVRLACINFYLCCKIKSILGIGF